MIPNFPIPADKTVIPTLIAKFKQAGPEGEKIAEELQAYLDKDSTESWLKKIICSDERMLKLKDDVRKLSTVDDPVLIFGETGTGKELIANALHGERKGKFIPVNCAAIPENLVESELFGHVKGSFTGADNTRAGLFEETKDGTIFLDEVGELPMQHQAKVLRAIQEKKIRRVGGSQEININCRVVSATHRSLETLIGKGHFREDLYWRISTFILKPLPILEWSMIDVDNLLKYLDTENRIDAATRMHIITHIQDKQTLRGNVRSLQQLVRRFYVLKELPK